MRAARLTSAVTALVGLGIGLFFMTFGPDMYKIHGMFQAFVSPPIVAAVFLGAFWKRFTSAGAIGALAGGIACIGLSKLYPQIVKPFAHGVQPDASGQYNYMTAFFGLFCAALIGIVVSLLTRPKSEEELKGLWIGTMDFAMRRFKGAEPNHEVGEKVTADLVVSEDGTTPPTSALTYEEYLARSPRPDAEATADAPPPAQPETSGPEYAIVRLSTADLRRLKARPGDLLYVADARRWLGGLRSAHCRAGEPHELGNVVLMSQAAYRAGRFLPGRRVRVEKVF